MTDAPLIPPQRWANQIAAGPSLPLALSYNPHALQLPRGRPLDDVVGDLERGAWLTRTSETDDSRFRLGGEEFELRLLRKRTRDSGVCIAMVLNVDEARLVPRKIDRLVPKVSFTPVWHESQCDLGEILEDIRERREQLRAQSRYGGAGQTEVRRHGWLQAEVRRQYGELETLIELLEQRPEQEKGDEPQATGVIQGASEHLGRRAKVDVAVIDGANPSEFRNRRIRLALSDGSIFNTRVSRIKQNVLTIEQPNKWGGQTDDRVTLQVVPPFGMRRNADALQTFLSGQQVGSWNDLARLLCLPKDLLLPGKLSRPAVFYCDDDSDMPMLNEEQRLAVAGAVSSPHAFLVQGPPGTGKTAVISEIVRQLVGRGERVLMLAPTHVAVDEVLRRVGHKPGLRPLRITWTDELVDERLHQFLPQNVGVELASRVLRPTNDDQSPHWMREQLALTSQLVRINRLRELEQSRVAAVTALQQAQAVVAGVDARLRARRKAAAAERSRLERELADNDAALGSASERLRQAMIFLDVKNNELMPGLNSVRQTSGELARAASAAVNATRAQEEAARQAAPMWHRAEIAAAGERRHIAARAAAEAYEGMQLADRELATAQQVLETSVIRQTGAGRLAEQFGFGGVARARRKVTQAQNIAANHKTAWVDWDAALANATADHTQAVREAEVTRLALDAATAQLRGAEQQLAHTIRAFAISLAALGAALPEPSRETAAQYWWQLGEEVHARVAEALDSPASATRILTTPELTSVAERIGRLRDAALTHVRCQQDFDAAVRRRAGSAEELQHAMILTQAELAQLTADRHAAEAALTARRAKRDQITAERDDLAVAVGEDDPEQAQTRLLRRRHVLDHLPRLIERWRALTTDQTDDTLVNDIKTTLVRATNLVCATTTGIVARGSEIIRYTDFDTLIVDEASRVTESEFLIGAVRARRWVLVGDEHQLSPYVDQKDEHFLHAVTALYRAERRMTPLDQSVGELAVVWSEEEELRSYRKQAVLDIAIDLTNSGAWDSVFRGRFVAAYEDFAKRTSKRIRRSTEDFGKEPDTDRALLAAMLRYLVRSLFQRVVPICNDTLKQPLIWQRRMITPLAEIVNKPIYGGRYKSPPEADLANVGVTPLVTRTFTRPVVFLDTSHHHNSVDRPARSGHGFVNEFERDLVADVCRIYDQDLAASGATEPVTASVLTFYRAQANELNAKLRALDMEVLQWQVIDVIDKIQGQQSDLVILSFTRASRNVFSAQYGQWLQDLRRLNVACTRARRAMVLVGHGSTLHRLRSSEAAVQFYGNLLSLFDSHPDFQHRWKLKLR